MRDDGKDPYDIRKQEEVLQESYMMVPDSKVSVFVSPVCSMCLISCVL